MKLTAEALRGLCDVINASEIPGLHRDLEFAQSTTVNRLDNISSICGLTEHDNLIAFFDNSYFRTGKSGIYFTGNGVFWKNMLYVTDPGVFFVDYATLCGIDNFKFHGSSITFLGHEVDVWNIPAGSKQIALFLSKLRQFLIANDIKNELVPVNRVVSVDIPKVNKFVPILIGTLVGFASAILCRMGIAEDIPKEFVFTTSATTAGFCLKKILEIQYQKYLAESVVVGFVGLCLGWILGFILWYMIIFSR